MKTNKIVSVVSPFFIILFLSAVVFAASWKTFSSSADKFKADFPDKPAFSTKKVKIPQSNLVVKHNTYKSKDPNGVSYYVIITTFNLKLDTSNPDENLKGSLGDILSSSKSNKLISSKFGKFKGNRSLDFLVQNGNISMKGKLFFVKQALFELLAAYEGQKLNNSEYDKFVNSFSLK